MKTAPELRGVRFCSVYVLNTETSQVPENSEQPEKVFEFSSNYKWGPWLGFPFPVFIFTVLALWVVLVLSVRGFLPMILIAFWSASYVALILAGPALITTEPMGIEAYSDRMVTYFFGQRKTFRWDRISRINTWSDDLSQFHILIHCGTRKVCFSNPTERTRRCLRWILDRHPDLPVTEGASKWIHS